MLTESQIKKLIVLKLYRLQGCKDRETIIKHIHLFRGMLMVMLERDPGDLDNVPDILDLINIPYKNEYNEYYIDENWLEENGIK
jgi:hypothetical protein